MNIHNNQDKSLSQPQSNQNTNQTTDSKTKVYQRLHGGRSVVSIRVKPELKEALKSFCKAKGLSLCHITEGLWTAFLYGVGQKIELVNQGNTIELTLVRDVKRFRRYAIEEVRFEERCHFCKRDSVDKFRYIKTGEVFGLCGFHAKEMLESLNWESVYDE